MRSAFRNKSSIVAVLAFGLAIFSIGMFFVLKNSDPNSRQVLAKQVEHHDSKTGVTVNYPEDAGVGQISEEDKKSNIIFRFTEKSGQVPYLVTLRYESGLRLVANLTKAEIIDVVMGNSTKALPKRFPGYKEEDRRRFELNGHKAGEIIFTYDSPVKGERIKQRFVILVKDDDTAAYLAMQAREADYDEQNQKIFSSIAASLNFK